MKPEKIKISEDQAFDMIELTDHYGQKTFDNWKLAGFIKPSKIDEVREWVRKNEYATGSTHADRAYAKGVRDCWNKVEVAITEILEERNA